MKFTYRVYHYSIVDSPLFDWVLGRYVFFSLVPRLRLGTHCLQGSAFKFSINDTFHSEKLKTKSLFTNRDDCRPASSLDGLIEVNPDFLLGSVTRRIKARAKGEVGAILIRRHTKSMLRGKILKRVLQTGLRRCSRRPVRNPGYDGVG